jgi:hypothetical protein
MGNPAITPFDLYSSSGVLGSLLERDSTKTPLHFVERGRVR